MYLKPRYTEENNFSAIYERTTRTFLVLFRLEAVFEGQHDASKAHLLKCISVSVVKRVYLKIHNIKIPNINHNIKIPKPTRSS
jgi:hypothetical protein